MLQNIVTYVLKVLGVLPNLITTMETLWSGQPKTGGQKWLGVEQALSGSIQVAAETVAKMAPAGTKPEIIATAIDKFTKDANDAFVTLMNDLGLFTKSS